MSAICHTSITAMTMLTVITLMGVSCVHVNLATWGTAQPAQVHVHAHAHAFQQCYFSDINECNMPHLHNCHGNSVCENTDGSFMCTCKPGYMMNGTTCSGTEVVKPWDFPPQNLVSPQKKFYHSSV